MATNNNDNNFLSNLIITFSNHKDNNFSPPKTTILLFLIVSLISILSSLFISSLLRKPKPIINLPPSPPRWPLIGNLHQLGPSLHRSFDALSEKYGPVMLVHMGRAPTLVVSSLEAVKELVRNHDVDISNRPMTKATKVVSYGNRNLTFSPFGEYWRQARRIAVHELLSPNRVQHFRFIREEETEKLIQRVHRICVQRRIRVENPESVTENDDQGKLINLSEMVLATANNTVARCIIGHSFTAEDGQNLAAGMARKVMEITTAVIFLEDFMPWLSWLDIFRGVTAQLRSTFRELDEFLDKVIENREALISSDPDDNDDDISKCYYLVDVLLEIKKRGSCDFELTRDSVKALLLDLLTDGTDSTSVVVEWSMAELVRNPRVMKKVQEEVRRVIGKKSKIEADDINRMDYLKCVIKESLRLHPPGPLLPPREVINDIKIGGYDVPAKTRLFVNARSIQRDPNLWDRPEEFFPERFEENPAELRLGQDLKLIPFGFGRRGCPGLGFAVAGIEYLIANLLYWFDWELDFGLSPDQVDMSEAHGLFARKKAPLHLVPIIHSF